MRACLVWLVAAGATLSAQQQDQTAHPPVFRTGVDLVRFDVRVTDSAGRPVTDLRPQEIEILEGGQVRPLLQFQHITEPAGAYADAALRAVSAEVTSNQGTPRGHLYLLVFDQNHITSGNEQVARRAAETFIKTRVRPSDRIAIVGIPGPGPDIGFTADRNRALTALQRVHGALERNVSTAAGRLSVEEAYEISNGNDQAITNVLTRQSVDLTADVGSSQSSGVSGLLDRAATRQNESPAVSRQVIQENARTLVAQTDADSRQFLQRLADLIEQYRTIEGRKTLILFSEGFHQQNVTREVEQVAASAAQSYAVVYAFDMNRHRSELDQPLMPATNQATEILVRSEPLGSLALETDGLLLRDAAEQLDKALNQIADQSQDYYLVGFEPSEAATANRGQYRRVSVRVTREGTHVSARTGYAAPRDSAPLDRRRAIDFALAAPFVQQGLRVGYTTYTMRSGTTGRARVVLALEADLPVRDAAHDSADVVFVVRDARDGRVAASGTDTMRLPGQAAPGASAGVATFHVQFELTPGTYLMRTVVREPGGTIGSADRRLEVRPFSGPDLSVSDLVLGSATGSLPVRAQAYSEDGLAGMLEAYARAGDQLQRLSITVTLVPAGSDQPVATVQGTLSEAEAAGGGILRRVTFSLPLTEVPPGAYIARVRVRSGDEAVADLSRDVDVHPGSAPAPSAVAERELPKPSDVLEGDFVKSARMQLRQVTTPAAIHAVKGFDLFARADYPAAATELSQAMKLDQTNAATAFVLGWAYEYTGADRDAISAWRAAAAIDPKMVPAHLALADAYLKLSQPGLAAQALRAGLAALPDSVELQAKLAEIDKR